MMIRRQSLNSLLFIIALSGMPSTADAKKPYIPLHERSVKEIINQYTFVADLTQQEDTRPLKIDEIFWRYPFKLDPVTFSPTPDLLAKPEDVPQTKGVGRAIEHLNRGRSAFILGLEGDSTEFENARKIWLTGRHLYGETYPFHRRNDFFVANAFLKKAFLALRANNLDWGKPEVKGNLDNAATFLSWALIVKRDQKDEYIDQFLPSGLLNLSKIYWRYNRVGGAYGAAETRLEHLRKTGLKDDRSDFHQILAEAHIVRRGYLEAIQEYDVLIRHDPDHLEAVANAFARVGDIYFDLNNYELAEDMYALSNKVYQQATQFDPKRLLIRAESQFWIGDFVGAQKSIFRALEGEALYEDASLGLSKEDRSWASLRMADAYLALKKYDEAKLAYFKVSSDFGSSLPAKIARLREACLELPIYERNNVKHARELLEQSKSMQGVPEIVQEIAWTCQVQSYTDRERTDDMVNRVRKFAERYPEAKILKSFVTPIREVQATKIDPYIKSGDTLSMVSFFEKNRQTLFPKVPQDLKIRLFEAYADMENSKKAAEFYHDYQTTPDSDLKILRLAAVSGELSKDKKWLKEHKDMAAIVRKRLWRIEPSDLVLRYYQRIRFASPQDLVTMHTLAHHFAKENPTYYCDLEYPLLSKMAQDKGHAYKDLVSKRVNALIAGAMPALFKTDESCALSLLELEARYLLKSSDELANTYLTRESWPLVGGYLHLYWIIAEQVNERGNNLKARMMWDMIKAKAPEGTSEREFATARLDATKTENEKLWN